jgi:FkbM family methyltransferase
MTLVQTAKNALLSLGPNNKVTQFAVKAFAKSSSYDVSFTAAAIVLKNGDRTLKMSKSELSLVPLMLKQFNRFFDTICSDIPGREVLDFSRPGDHTYKRTGWTLTSPATPEDDSIDMYFRASRPNRGVTVFDAGANVGLTALELSHAVGETGRVYAFEPDVQTLGYLQHNLRSNSAQNVTVMPYALSETTGTAQFKMDGTMSASLVGSMRYSDCSKPVNVQTYSLEDACGLVGVVPSYIKADIEGAEVGFVKGALKFLQTHAIEFAFESGHPLQDGSMASTHLERMFSGIGYKCWSGTDPYGTTFTWASPFK